MRSPLRGSGQLSQRNPRLAKSHLGLNSGRCFAARWRNLLSTQPKARKSLALGLTLTAASQLVGEIAFNVTQDSQSRALGLTLTAASQLVGAIAFNVTQGSQSRFAARWRIAELHN